MSDGNTALGVTVAAPAKVNLFLHVIGRRPDGYHDLESRVVFTEFGDSVRVVPASEFSFERCGPFADALPDDRENDLCCVAARAFAAELRRGLSLRIVLEKNIPVAAGIGGGSADAGAVLRAMCDLWQIPRDDPRATRTAIALGADVPMCFFSRPCLATGVGDELEFTEGARVLEILLVNPGAELSTASVFGALRVPDKAPAAMSREGDVAWLRNNTRNDLAVPAAELCPVIQTVLDEISDAGGCQLARMSGSGSTCFGIFEDAAAAAEAARKIEVSQPGWWVRATRTTV